MHERDRGVSLDDATRLASFRALRPAGVADIYYDEHTPSNRVDPNVRGSSPGGASRTARNAASGARMPATSLDMEWDLDEPPTQMWSAQQALAATAPPAPKPRSVPPAIPQSNPYRSHVATLPAIPLVTAPTSPGRVAAARARVSTPPPPPAAARARTISGTAMRSVRDTGSASVPVVAAPAPRRLPPPPSRGPNLLPEMAHDSRFYPGLVPSSRELDDSDMPRERGLSTWIWLAAGAATLVVLGVTAYNLLSGPSLVSVVIETTPVDASVSIDDHALTGASPYTQDGLKIGDHTLLVQKPGFLIYREVFALSDHEAKRILFVKLSPQAEPMQAPAAVVAHHDPAPAAAQEPPPPAHESKWHAKHKSSPSDDSDENLSSPEQAKRHRSQVRAAKIAIRWREKHGLPPRDSDVALANETPTTDVIEVSHTPHGHKTATSTYSAPAPSSSYAAAPSHATDPPPTAAARAPASGGATGTLQINSRPWADVYIDGQLVGHTPQMHLALTAGHHSVKLMNPQMNMSKVLNVSIRAGETLTKVEQLSE